MELPILEQIDFDTRFDPGLRMKHNFKTFLIYVLFICFGTIDRFHFWLLKSPSGFGFH